MSKLDFIIWIQRRYLFVIINEFIGIKYFAVLLNVVRAPWAGFSALKGLAAADKGYIDQALTENLEKRDLRLITKVRKNMKKKMLSAFEIFFLNQRNIIETIIDQLKALYHIQHTRHRSPFNFLVNILGALIAYAWKPNKVGVKCNYLSGKNYALIQN